MPWAFAQLRAALAPAMNRGIQRAPRTGVIVPPGRVPEPPECPADEARRAGTAQANVGSTPSSAPGPPWLISACASRPLHQAASPVDAPRRERGDVCIVLQK